MKSRRHPLPVAICDGFKHWPGRSLRPLFRDFMGLNETHLAEEQAGVYRRLGRLLRDYHSARSDLGDDSKFDGSLGVGRDGRDWVSHYQNLHAAGWRTSVSLMFERLQPHEWKDLASDSRAYARRFAATYLADGDTALIEAVEVGNEPGEFSNADYRVVLRAVSQGLKAGAPGLRVATAALTTGPSHAFYRSVDSLEGLEDCYDVLTIHTYAEIEGWPTWERSFPEDQRLQNYLIDVRRLCRWRDAHVPEKEIWITEFGYDAIDCPPDSNGIWKHWRSSTDLQQAQWTVRSWLVFATFPVARAYYFFFDDLGEPKMHHASGMTRRGNPRPVFFATAHLQATLADYRVTRVVLETPGQVIILEFSHERDDSGGRIWVAWSPTGEDRSCVVELPSPPGEVVRAEYMPIDAEPIVAVWDSTSRYVTLTESPLYLHLRTKHSKTNK